MGVGMKWYTMTENFLRLGRQGGIDPANQNTADDHGLMRCKRTFIAVTVDVDVGGRSLESRLAGESWTPAAGTARRAADTSRCAVKPTRVLAATYIGRRHCGHSCCRILCSIPQACHTTN